MTLLSYPLYDTALFSTTAGVTHTLFQVGQGAQSTKGFTITNMRGSGQLPDKEKFTLHKIGVHVDDISLSPDDIIGLFAGSILTFEYNNVKILQAPLFLFSDRNAYGGVLELAAAAAKTAFGQVGDGYMLNNRVEIQGGKNFKVDVYQALALDTADQDVKVVLYGDLDSPDIRLN